MEELVVALLVLVSIAVVLCAPLALVLVLSLRSEVRRLRAEIAAIRAGAAPAADAAPPAASVLPPAAPPFAPPAAAEATAAASAVTAGLPLPHAPASSARSLEAVIGGEWLTWIGIITIFFGTAFFLAIDLGSHRLAGAGQVLAGVAVGALFTGIGLRLGANSPRRVLSQGLLGGGVALFFLAAYGAHGFHQLVSAPVVYPLLIGAAIVGTLVALRRGAISIAILTAIGALLTPLLLRPDTDPTRLLFPYLLVVNAGAALVAIRRQWLPLTAVAFLLTAVAVVVWGERWADANTRNIALLFGAVLWAGFVATPLLTARRGRVWGFLGDAILLLNGGLFALYLSALLGFGLDARRGAALLALAIVHWFGARRLPREQFARARATLQALGIALAVVAAAVQFDDWSTTLSWILLGVCLVFTGVRFASVLHRVLGLGVFVLTSLRVFFFDGYHSARSSSLHAPGLNAEFLVGIGAALAIGASVVLLHRHREDLRPWERQLLPALTTMATVLLWGRISTEIFGAFRTRELAANALNTLRRPMLLTLSLAWALYGGALVAGGFLGRYRPLRVLGVIVLGVLVLKVFVFDIQELERGYRIASFVGVGVLLLVVSLLYQRDRSS